MKTAAKQESATATQMKDIYPPFTWFVYWLDSLSNYERYRESVYELCEMFNDWKKTH